MPEEVLVVVGTRPEAVKLGPVIRAGASAPDLHLRRLATGQHRGLLQAVDSTLECPEAALGADVDRLSDRVCAAIAERRPSAVLAQGDTASALAAARAASALGVPFVHVEAGLRTGDVAHPFPEESNRIEVTRLASLHLAPTAGAAENLRREGVSDARVVVTGNTAVDAVIATRAALPANGDAPSACLRAFGRSGRRVVVTHHRRESLPVGAQAVARAVRRLAGRHADVDVVVSVHPNPALADAFAALVGVPNIHLLPPLSHAGFVWLLAGSEFAISDSGGVQEEAPSLGTPVLVTRLRTERPEALVLGAAKLVGWDERRIENDAARWLEDRALLERARPRRNPFGDGRAGPRCVAALRYFLGLASTPAHPWDGDVP